MLRELETLVGFQRVAWVVLRVLACRDIINVVHCGGGQQFI